jgi:hypothetical protein
MKHKHADSMAAYAKDAMISSTPWEMWESSQGQDYWSILTAHPIWDWELDYRRKVETITINGIKVPEPMREAPDVGQLYHVVALLNIQRFDSFVWDGSDSEQEWLDSGLCHLTKDAAYNHASALLSFTAL